MNKNSFYKLLIKKLIPRKIRRNLINLKLKIVAFSLLNSKFYRDYYIRKSIINFEPNKKYLVKNLSPKWKLAAFWDTDGRFKWLQNICEKENVDMIHIPRVLYRNVFHYLFFSRGYLQDLGKGELPLNLFYDKNFSKERKIYLNYCENVTKSISSQFKSDIFLLFKLNDDWIIDVLNGIKNAKFPVVVHDREHGITPKRMEIYPSHLEKIKKDLDVDKLCTSNETHYKFFLKCGIKREKLVLTGKPDADAWFYKDKKVSKRELSKKINPDLPLITYFSFSKFNYLNFFYEGEERNWLELADDYHNVLIEVLRKFNGELQIVYKLGGKPVRDFYPGFESFMERLNKLNLQNSIILLDSNISTIDLLKVSDCILGFHTLGIVEAMFTDKPILFGAWGELFNDIKETLIPFHKLKGIHYCDSPIKLKNSLINVIDKKSIFICDRKIRDAEIETFFYKADGRSSKRLFSVLEDVYKSFYKEL